MWRPKLIQIQVHRALNRRDYLVSRDITIRPEKLFNSRQSILMSLPYILTSLHHSCFRSSSCLVYPLHRLSSEYYH